MTARGLYALWGAALGAAFPLCALGFAYFATPSAAQPSFLAFALQAHGAQPAYFLIDCAPLLVGLIAFLVGMRQDLANDLSSSLRHEVTSRTETMQRLAGDIEARRRVEAQLAHQTFHDALTGLANRALFANRTEHALARARRSKHDVAVLLLDLDDFKTINDSLGHDRGDALLAAAAARFDAVVRDVDTLARFGGDEFALLVESAANVQQVVALGQRLIDAMSAPVKLDTRYVRIGVSVGVAFGRADATPETLVRDAELAMYDAKTRGKDCLRVFRPEMHSALVARVEIGGDLQRAIVRREFYLMYQPIVELADNRIIGMEALVRWNHPQRGIIAPADFIKIAEDTNTIVPLGSWILKTACRQMAAWQHQRTGAHPLSLTVNVSPIQLQHPRFVDDVQLALGGAGLAPQQLVLEITESALVDNTAENLAIFSALKALGVRLAIDDFGTGYSSLSYLQRFPFDILKIDKAFVDDIAGGGTDAAFARTIIALGGLLDLRVLAEGIEHETQRAVLKELGCRYAQGYLFAKPLDVAAMSDLLHAAASPETIAVAS